MRKVKFVTNRTVWQLGLTTGTSCEFKSRANCLARLKVLSCSVPAGVTLQLPSMLHTYASFGNSPVVRSSHEALLECTLLSFSSHSLTLPLHDSHLNTGFLNAELQANWHVIKPTKWLIKFKLTIICCNICFNSNIYIYIYIYIFNNFSMK